MQKGKSGSLVLAVVLALAAVVVHPAPQATPAKSAEPLPTIEQLLERYVQALGGRAALEKIVSRVAKGVTEVPDANGSGSTEVYQKAPNKYLLVSEYPNFGLVRRGFDGTSGWSEDPDSGLVDITGPSLTALRRNTDFYRETKLKDQYVRMAVVGKEKVGDRETYVLEAIPGEGGVERMYFDRETMLLAWVHAERPTPQGVIPVDTRYEDYRTVDGVKVAFLIRYTNPNIRLVTRLQEVRHNVEIDDAKFRKPSRPQAQR